MGIKGWYYTGNKTDSSYTDFTAARTGRPQSSYTDFTVPVSSRAVSTYTDFTDMSSNRPVRVRPVRKVAGKKVKSKRRKKSAAGKIVIFVSVALVIVLVSFLMKDVVVEACSNSALGEYFAESDDTAENNFNQIKKSSVKGYQTAAKCAVCDRSDPVYGLADQILESLRCDNDVDTAWEIFNWVHSNIYYQAITEEMTYEEAAYRGFTRRSGDCYVYFSCAKMLLDCAGIPNLMVERYPVITNGHYWNLVQLNGEWYHCDATVFKDHADMYFMCTDEEIDDSHHEFDHSLYPERASWYSGYNDDYYQADDIDYYWDEPYTDYEDVWE